MAKFADRIDKLGQSVCNGYKKLENGVVSAYKKIENGAVNGFEKFSDQCVDALFAKEGESVVEAKKRLSGNH